MTKYIILEKAKPYTRYRRGKLEQVRGYTGRPPSRFELQFVGQDLPHLRDFTQIGPQLGSQPGGLFKQRYGEKKWYIKRPPTEEHARNEKLTADLYQLAGVQVPQMKYIEVPVMREKEFGLDKGLGIASEWIEGLKEGDSASLKQKPAGLADGFAVDAWLANWDVVGTGWDNIKIDSTGHTVRVDTGGGLKYRARGGAKPLDDKVSEWDSMRTKHSPSKEVFGTLTDKELIDSGHKVMAIPDIAIQRLVLENGFGKELADLLIARKSVISKKVMELEAKVKKGVTFYVIDLEKAKPYTRYRRGRLEHVKGYAGKDRKPIEIKIDPAWGKQAEELQVRVDSWKKLRDNKEELAKLGYKYIGKEKVTEKYYVASLGMKEERETVTECDVVKHKSGAKIFVNAHDVPSQIAYDLTQWDTVLETAKKWKAPDVFYRGGTAYGDRFSWTTPDGKVASGEEAGVAQYQQNRIVINDDHHGWWVDAHEMGHFVMSRLVKYNDPRSKEDEKFVESLGTLHYAESAELYDKALNVCKALDIPLDKPEVARTIVSGLLAWDKTPTKSKDEVLKAYHDQGLKMYNEGFGAMTAVMNRLMEGKPAELSAEDRGKLGSYNKILKSWRKTQTKFLEWESICKDEPYKIGDPKLEEYINAKDRFVQENFAEFYQVFTINLFNLPKHNAIEPAWEGLQQLKNDNPKKFKFFTDTVFPKEYKAFRKVALEHMKFVEAKRGL